MNNTPPSFEDRGGYIVRQVRQMCRMAEDQKAAARVTTKPALPAKSMEQRITDWHRSLPASLQQVPRLMEELVKVIPGSRPGRGPNTAEMGITLGRMGWKRKRIWVGPHHRWYWVPPVEHTANEGDDDVDG